MVKFLVPAVRPLPVPCLALVAAGAWAFAGGRRV